MLKPAIVLSSYTMGLGVIRALGQMGIPVVAVYYDPRDMGYLSKYVVERFPAPHPEQNPAEFIDLLVECAARFGGSLLVPASDAALVAVSKNKRLLETHYIVACPDWETTRQFIDKNCTYALAEDIGVPAPKTVIPRSAEDLEKYHETIQYPCLVKPCQSHRYVAIFKQKMVLVKNFDQLLCAYQQASSAKLEVMVQEFIPGEDSLGANYNSYFSGGEALVEFTAQKVRNAPPELGSPRVAISQPVPEVLEPGRKILRALGFYGFSCTEFKKDPRDGIYKLVEVNGRHNLSSLLAVRCGINFPWIQYKHLVLGELPSAQGYETGVYWIDITRDVGSSLKYYRKEHYSLSEYLKPYRQRHVFAILDWKDPKPFIKRCSDLVISAVHELL